jgi:hypothetical protein
MLDETTLEQRLVTLERAVADLQGKSQNQSTSENWLEKLIGSVSDQAAFIEALECRSMRKYYLGSSRG